MYRYILGIVGYRHLDQDEGTELEALRLFITESLERDELDGLRDPPTGRERLDWLVEQSIDHHYHIERVTYDLSWQGHTIDRTTNIICVHLPHAVDADWMRYRFNVLPLPPEADDPLWIVADRRVLKAYWL
jgi:hypothetical protein